MGRKKSAAVTISPLTTAEEWQTMLDTSTEKLVVIDVSKGWCGPCEVVMPVWDALVLEYEDWESILSFRGVTTSGDVLPQVAKEMGEDAETCRPTFLFYRNRELVQKVVGCNAPRLREVVTATVKSTGLVTEQKEES
eukprot:g5464.t1